MILPATAHRTGGFCMPHSGHSLSFLEALEAEPAFEKPVPQKEVLEEVFHAETKQALGLLFSIMIAGDELRMFSAKPVGESPFFAARGVALFRGGKCITGFVTKWSANPAFDRDLEEACPREVIQAAFGNSWKDIEDKIPEGATYISFRTSPRSWACLCGRAGFAVKYKGEYLWSVITWLN
jgi:hypothetical protein